MEASATVAKVSSSRRVKPVEGWTALAATVETYPEGVRILVTNDDGIASRGLLELAAALGSAGEVTVVAPATNMTAASRSITLREEVLVDEVDLPDGSVGFAVAGTPTDCVRFAMLGLAGEAPELVVSGINQGANLGDDVGYSGTVAAAVEGLFAGLPAIAVSQRSLPGTREWDLEGRTFDYRSVATFTARLVEHVAAEGLPPGTLLNVNAPGLPPDQLNGVRVTRLGQRIYRTTLELVSRDSGRRQYRLWDDDPSYHREEGTDFTAIAEGCISVTPLHYDLTAHAAIDTLAGWDLASMLARPA
jgi:5'-nucleotidase